MQHSIFGGLQFGAPPAPIKMESFNVVQRCNTLKLCLVVTNSTEINCMVSILSPEYVIDDSTVFQAKVVAGKVGIGINLSQKELYSHKNIVFLRFAKYRRDDDLTYTVKLTCRQFGITNKCFTSDDGTWHQVNENNDMEYTIDLAIEMDIVHEGVSYFSRLHEDVELTDFELKGVDGSVRFHKLVLAISSPVLEKMVKGPWEEATEGHSVVTGTSKKTLQHLKNYMYLNTLPDEDLEQLLLLSSFYMMQDLEQRCVDKLVNRLTDENACELIEFAASNKMMMLTLAIMKCAGNKSINGNKIYNDYLREKQVIFSGGNKTIQQQ